MPETKLFRDPAELESREAFDPDAEISRENFSHLICEYEFKQKVRCQVHKADGACGRLHNRGWFGVNKDGSEGYIGGHCANKRFIKGDSFFKEQKRIRREREFAELTEHLELILSRRDELRSMLWDLGSELSDSRAIFARLQTELPKTTQSRLQEMSRTGNSAIIIEYQFIERDQKGKVVSKRWDPSTIGEVSSVEIWQQGFIWSVSDLVKRLEKTLDEISLDGDPRLRSLKLWSKRLEPLETINADVERVTASIKKFSTTENLGRLVYLQGNGEDQRDLVKLAHEFNGGAPKSDFAYRQDLVALDRDIRAANGDRNFRVPR